MILANHKTPDVNIIEQELDKIGAAFFEPSETVLSDNQRLKLLEYYAELPNDQYGTGKRLRAYTRLQLDLQTGKLERAENQVYSQTYEANKMNGEEDRKFERVPYSILEEGPLGVVVGSQVKLLRELYIFKKKVVRLGVHTVRYIAEQGKPTFSSPIMYHKDDEPAVILTVLSKSPHLIGGETFLSRNLKDSVDRVVSLKAFESALLTKDTFHMVAPMESSISNELAWRDILLLTVEEQDDVLIRNNHTY